MTLFSQYRSTTKPSCNTVHSDTLAAFHRNQELNTSYIRDRRPILVLGQLELYVTIGDLQFRAILNVADTPVVDILLRTVFINDHILEFFQTSLRWSRDACNQLLSYPRIWRAVKITAFIDNLDFFQMKVRDADVKAARQLGLEPRSTTPGTIVSTARGLLQFEKKLASVQRQFLAANGITELITNTPFQILPTNISSQHVHVPKHIVMRQICNNLKTISDLNPLPPTLTEGQTSATAVSIVVSGNKNSPST